MAAANDVSLDAAVAQSFNQHQRHFYLKRGARTGADGLLFWVEEVFLFDS